MRRHGERRGLRLLRSMLLLMLLRLGMLPGLGHCKGTKTTDHQHTGNAGGDQAATKALKRLGYFAHSCTPSKFDCP
jgi:hypothetical protein